MSASVDLYFSDYFRIDPDSLAEFGAFNISLVSDLPLFVDPFLLFNSEKEEYRHLHESIIRYLRFLLEKSTNLAVPRGLILALYRFPEVKQNWLGFSRDGRGKGLGMDFAQALNSNLSRIFSDFGSEKITTGTHLEKLCLISDGVGRDKISDFTTNLVKGFLAQYTEQFASQYIREEYRRNVVVERHSFNYSTETWVQKRCNLPIFGSSYVLLTPMDILKKDRTWINRPELLEKVYDFADTLPDEALRAQLSNYLRSRLSEKPSKEEKKVTSNAVVRFPSLIDHFIQLKEEEGDKARALSAEDVLSIKRSIQKTAREISTELLQRSGFYDHPTDSYEEALKRSLYFKDCIENKDTYKALYIDGLPIATEEMLHLIFKLVWFAPHL